MCVHSMMGKNRIIQGQKPGLVPCREEAPLTLGRIPSGPDLWTSNPYACQKYPADLKDRPEEERSISQPLKPGYPEAPPADPHGAATSGPTAHL